MSAGGESGGGAVIEIDLRLVAGKIDAPPAETIERERRKAAREEERKEAAKEREEDRRDKTRERDRQRALRELQRADDDAAKKREREEHARRQKEAAELREGRLAEAGAIDDAVKAAQEEAIADALGGPEAVDRLRQAAGLVGQVEGEGLRNLASFAKNPPGFLEGAMARVVTAAGPYGLLVGAVISAAATAPEMVKAVIGALGLKGGPLNQDYRFSVEEQEALGFTRQLQYRRLTGDDPVITVTTRGFVVGDPDFVDNSLVDIETGRTARVNLRQTSLRYLHGI